MLSGLPQAKLEYLHTVEKLDHPFNRSKHARKFSNTVSLPPSHNSIGSLLNRPMNGKIDTDTHSSQSSPSSGLRQVKPCVPSLDLYVDLLMKLLSDRLGRLDPQQSRGQHGTQCLSINVHREAEVALEMPDHALAQDDVHATTLFVFVDTLQRRSWFLLGEGIKLSVRRSVLTATLL